MNVTRDEYDVEDISVRNVSRQLFRNLLSNESGGLSVFSRPRSIKNVFHFLLILAPWK